MHRVGFEVRSGDRLEGSEATWSVTKRALDAVLLEAFNDFGEKCSAAVGAATAPGVLAKMV